MRRSLLDFQPTALETLARRLEERVTRFSRACTRLVIFWSGGKDSTTSLLIAGAALGRRVPAALAMVPGQTDMGVITRVARALGYRLEPCPAHGPCTPREGTVLVAYRRASFWSLLERYGLPSESGGRKRWCCSLFKSEPLRRVEADCAISSVKRGDSTWRARRYTGLDSDLPVIWRDGRRILLLLYDIRDALVWSLLRHYSPHAHEILHDWYKRHPGSPDCRLCLIVGRRTFEQQARAAPPRLRAQTRQVLERIRPRVTPGSATRRRLEELIAALNRVEESGVG